MERQVLKSQADALRAQLQAIESRLAESDEKKEKPE
jgi:prefoldin subunit 5